MSRCIAFCRYFVGMALFKGHGLMRRFNVPERVVRNYFRGLNDGYADVPYHNAAHAADALHSVHWMWINFFGQSFGFPSVGSGLDSGIGVDDDFVPGLGREGGPANRGRAVTSDGSYGIPEGLIFSFPCTVDANNQFNIVQGVELSDAARARVMASAEELVMERDTVRDLL